MKVIAINGSPRKKGNTSIAIEKVFEVLGSEGIETEVFNIGGKAVKGCTACSKCKENKDGLCVLKGDDFNDIFKEIYDAQGLIVGSPVYFGSLTPETKAFIDRLGYTSRAGGFLLKRKVCAGIAIERRQGAAMTISQINNLFMLTRAITIGSIYWNMAIGRGIGEILDDEEGMKTFKVIGEEMAWLIKKIN